LHRAPIPFNEEELLGRNQAGEKQRGSLGQGRSHLQGALKVAPTLSTVLPPQKRMQYPGLIDPD